MAKWAVTLLVLVTFVQVQEALSGSAGQAAVPDPNLETLEEQVWPGLHKAQTGLFLLNSIPIREVSKHASCL